MRILIFVLALLIGCVSAVEAQYKYEPTRNGGVRYCNNPNCAMCNAIWGPIGGFRNTYSESGNVILKPKNTTTVDTDLLPTPQKVVDVMLELVKPRKDQWVYDLGCGDGRIVASAVKEYGCMSLGIEINPESVKKARDLITKEKLTERALIIEGDILKFDYDKADIITLYLYPDLIEKVVPLIKPGTTVISSNHDIPGVMTSKRIVEVDGVDYEFYIWEVK